MLSNSRATISGGLERYSTKSPNELVSPDDAFIIDIRLALQAVPSSLRQQPVTTLIVVVQSLLVDGDLLEMAALKEALRRCLTKMWTLERASQRDWLELESRAGTVSPPRITAHLVHNVNSVQVPELIKATQTLYRVLNNLTSLHLTAQGLTLKARIDEVWPSNFSGENAIFRFAKIRDLPELLAKFGNHSTSVPSLKLKSRIEDSSGNLCSSASNRLG